MGICSSNRLWLSAISSFLHTNLPRMTNGLVASIKGMSSGRNSVNEWGRLIIIIFQRPSNSGFSASSRESWTPDQTSLLCCSFLGLDSSISQPRHLLRFSLSMLIASGLRSDARICPTRFGRLTRCARAVPTPQNGSATAIGEPIFALRSSA